MTPSMIPQPDFPPNSEVYWGVRRNEDGTDYLDEDLAQITLPNGYTLDFGAYGCSPHKVMVIVVNSSYEWSDPYEKIEVDSLEEGAAELQRLAWKWLKRSPLIPC